MALDKAKGIVSSNPVAVFSKTYCPFCVDVKKLFEKLGVTFKAIELDKERKKGKPCSCDGGDVQSALHQWTGQRTVPNVFIAGKHIGGCSETIKMHEEGKLVPLLTEAGAVAKSA